jgi:hypothetical protein
MSALNTIAVTSVLLGLQVAIAVADGPPKLDLAPTCDAAARFSIMAGRDKEACLEDEHTAESTLAQNWSKYNAVDKTQCIGNVKTGRPASCVELLSCLEIMRDAKEVGEGAPAYTVGPAGTVDTSSPEMTAGGRRPRPSQKRSASAGRAFTGIGG